MSAYHLRLIEKKDNLALAKIIRSAFEEFDAPKTGTVYSDPTTDSLFEVFQSKGAVCFVAEKEGELLGSCGLFPTRGLPFGHAELVKFYLSKNVRGKGIGKTLFEKTLHAAQQLNYTSVYIESQEAFSSALAMYEKYGFTYLDHPLGDSGHHNCGIWMLKQL